MSINPQIFFCCKITTILGLLLSKVTSKVYNNIIFNLLSLYLLILLPETHHLTSELKVNQTNRWIPEMYHHYELMNYNTNII